MTDCTFRTHENKEWVELLVGHNREWETEPGYIRPESFDLSVANHRDGRAAAVHLSSREGIALRDWLTEHIGE